MEEHSCCCCGGTEKTTMRTEEEKRKLLNRLKRIEGQVRGLQAMIERDAYCYDILTQSSAVNAAMNALTRRFWPATLRVAWPGISGRARMRSSMSW